MRNVVICGTELSRFAQSVSCVETASVEGVSVRCGVLSTDGPSFMPESHEHRSSVLLRKTAFSCNYRDRAMILEVAVKNRAERYWVIGSEFVAEVVAVGSNVRNFKPGDRVVGDNCYGGAPLAAGPLGIPTNHASRELEILHEAKVVGVPRSMPEDVAAAFSLGAQTSYAMVRRADVQAGQTVLVTSANSNTSLFVINALRDYAVDLYATSTSRRSESRLRRLGVRELFEIDFQNGGLATSESLRDVVETAGGFDVVIDPFFDLHIETAVESLAMGGTYISCGVADQHSLITGRPVVARRQRLEHVMGSVISKNLRVLGNCLGTSEDLERARDDYASGDFAVVVDSTFTDCQVGAFLERTFGSNDRFGKVVYRYGDRP